MSDGIHECDNCGLMCDCDGDDLTQPQPYDCNHLKRDCQDDDPPIETEDE